MIKTKLPTVYQFWSARSAKGGRAAQRMSSKAPNTIRVIPRFFFIAFYVLVIN